MKARGLVVERGRGEEVRRLLVAAGALRTDLAILRDRERVVFPLERAALVPSDWGQVEEAEFVPRDTQGAAEFRDLLPWTSDELKLLPRSFDIVGDVVLIRLPLELESRRFDVGEALLRFVPGSRIVGLDRGVRGPERRRSVDRIAGEGSWRTRHRENGLEFDVDLEQAYFSPRLSGEHARIAAEVAPGERVYDLCCGVGPFAVTMARDGRARSIVAVDANPAAVSLLRATLGRYPFGGLVTPVQARLEEFVGSAGPVDRLVLNLPHEGIKYAALVAPLVTPGGSLYYYEVVPRDEFTRRGTVVERALAEFGDWSVRPLRVVHPYSPSSDLVAVSALRGST